MRGVAATAMLALAAGCFAYPHDSKHAATLQQPPPQPLTFTDGPTFANDGNTDDCTEPDSFSGVFPRSSFGGFCCLFCADKEGNRDALICCPTIDQHGHKVSASPHPKHNPHPAPTSRHDERRRLLLQITVKLEMTSFHRANMCCGEYADDGEPEFGSIGVPEEMECVAPANEAIIVQQRNYDELVHMVITNLTNYYPVYPQYTKNEDGEAELDHTREGWLSNGQKDEHRISEGLVQFNQCNARTLDAEICFVEIDHKAIYMHDVRIRIFDFDMGKHKTELRKGPEAMQFNCAGGFFEVYGDNPPYVSWPAGKPIEVTKNATYNGLTAHRYKCPDDDYVTMWANMDGTRADNPTTPDPASLTADQEMRMIMIEFANTQCAPMTFASMPPRYRQVEGGWDMSLDASNGGNPLNGTLKLDYANFKDLKDEPCGHDGAGRNVMLSGYFDQSDVVMCNHPSPPPPAPTEPAPSNAVSTFVGDISASASLDDSIIELAGCTTGAARLPSHSGVLAGCTTGAAFFSSCCCSTLR